MAFFMAFQDALPIKKYMNIPLKPFENPINLP